MVGMKGQRSGRRVLHFAVTGALLGGGAAAGCTAKDKPVTNTAMVEDPEPSLPDADAPEERVNEGPQAEPEPHANEGPHPEPHANEGPQPEPKPKIMVNPARTREP